MIFLLQLSGNTSDFSALYHQVEMAEYSEVLPPIGNDNPNGSNMSKLAPIKNLISPYQMQSSHILTIFMGHWYPF